MMISDEDKERDGWLEEAQRKIQKKVMKYKNVYLIQSPDLVPEFPRKRIPGAPITVYLAGPMEGCSYEEASGWRDRITELFKRHDIAVRNPMVRDFREVFAQGKNIPPEIIIEPDKGDILQSDMIVVYYSQKTTGTSMEMLYAYYWGIPIITIAVKRPVSPWITYHSTAVVDDVDDAVNYICGLRHEIDVLGD